MLRRVLLVACCLSLFAVAFAARSQVLSESQSHRVTDWLELHEDERPELETLELPRGERGLSLEQSEQVREELWALYTQSMDDQELGPLPPSLMEMAQAQGGRIQIQARQMTLGELTMPFAVINRTEPEGGREEPARPALYICMHGGGANGDVDGPHAWPVNNREWQTQVQLAIRHYPEPGVYFIPRMADDRLGRWWHRHNHEAFERVIEQAVAHWGIDPNRIYILGISEGGFGTDILAPFMPDRFAGANAMAAGVDLANPPQNLRNLPFRTDVGENDTTFNRVGLAQRFHERLDQLHTDDEAGYTHSINVQAGRGHGIDYRPGVTWISQYTRDPWPDRLVWLSKTLHGVRRDRHYWVQLFGDVGTDPIRIAAEADRESNSINITAQRLQIVGDGGNPTHAHEGEVESAVPLSGVYLRLLLRDELVDLDRRVEIKINGEEAFNGFIPRDAAAPLRSIAGYGDPSMAASAEIEFEL